MKPLIRHIILIFFVCFFVTGVFAQSVTKVVITEGYPNAAFKKTVEENTSKLLNEFSRAYNAGTEPNFKTISISNNAVTNISDLWTDIKFYCSQSEIKEFLIKTNNGYQLRNIQVFTEDEKQEIFIEMNAEGMIIDIDFSLNLHQYKSIMGNSNEVVDITRREIILDFIEKLKVAYMRKNINFIDDVFSEKALIIVGKTIQKTDKPVMEISSNKETFARQSSGGTMYKKMTKQEYLTGLRRVFASNKRIDLDFKNIEVERHAKKGYEAFYGVRLRQHWKGDTYEDNGILFFLIQFRENDYPLIWVRTWQDANTTDKSEEIGFGDFRIRPE